MAEKNLPIKFFQKRQKDERNTEGGGGNLPKWVNVQNAREKSIFIRQALGDLSESLIKKVERNNYIPSIIKLKLNSNALAKTYRKEIGALFNISNKLNTIGISGEDIVLIKIDNVNDLQIIAEKIANADSKFPSKSTIIGLSAVIGIEEFKPQINIEPSGNTIYKVKLFNYGDTSLNIVLAKEFEKYCKKYQLDFSATSYTSELNIYRINGMSTDAFEDLKDFDGIQLVTEMPTYDITLDELTEEITIPVKQPKAGVDYPIVGVLDTGIANIPHLQPWLHNENITYYPDEDVDKSHGTFVAGVLLYGDELEGKEYTGFEGCKLLEAIVMPNTKKQQITEEELIQQIRDAISRNNDVKVWNLSLGTSHEADISEFSDFAKALDEIQEQNNVLICKSAGNCTNFKLNAPVSRIAKSADTVRGLVVGSLTHDKNETDIADKHNPSPFSRIGRGPSHLIKPDVVHIGGNAGLDASNNVILNPVKSFSPNGQIAKQVGTSFSTPRIAAITSGLDAMLNESFNPTLLKALIIHSAKYPEEMKMPIADKIRYTGFGLPSNSKDILFNEPNEITLILQDTLERGNFIEILDFPFPQSMIDDDGYFYGEISATLVTDPILDVSQGAEYCQSNIEVMLGTYDEKTTRDTTKSRIKNPIGAKGRKNILAMDNYSTKASKDLDTPFATERMLIAYSGKYQPIKKWNVSLDEFRDANKEKFLHSPKHWYLKLEGEYRSVTEEKCEKEDRIPSQEFCLVITIKDTKKKGNIYNEVTQLLDNFSFIHSNVKIKEEVRIRLNG
ncbi:hypothetical protein SDC9_35590 [bioreactor metagenome]|jgi:hypothetical protein|uniref:Peptidase S8/S53 domain-containing protein n=1 Tax=bioreactor metagenome TaxID=1076179 RepID=A0A644VDT7_9ZZZZ|nr:MULTISPECIES: S8 family peptidase [Bacteroidales]OJX56437.1 MAG: hypothetical protein BGO84_03110 [Dysgonomonas sp. 37-18]OJX90833.1 MAG: hypothetical protein BGP01_05585 [Paludibacter sp. 47-17]PKP37794.1 MAG: hypothetical protein CVT97_04265 [Bacteroidetes bacterium HGW-Bacteroidetes-14]